MFGLNFPGRQAFIVNEAISPFLLAISFHTKFLCKASDFFGKNHKSETKEILCKNYHFVVNLAPFFLMAAHMALRAINPKRGHLAMPSCNFISH